MKFFFHTKQELESVNLSVFKDSNGNGLLAKVLYSEKENEDLIEQFKRIYDAADIIADKRYDNDDDELNCFVGNNEPIVSCELLKTIYNNAKKCSTEQKNNNDKNRLHILKGLYYCAESIAQSEQLHMEPKSQTLYLLSTANICLRIAEVYYETSDFQQSNHWGNLAGERIWNGKCLVEQALDSMQAKKTYDCELMLCLYVLRLNQARYFLDYAKKNRRSNYSSTKDELDSLMAQFSDEQIMKIDSRFHRNLALIYVDAKLMQISILRRKYNTTSAKAALKEIKQFIECFSEAGKIMKETDSNYVFFSKLLTKMNDYDKRRSRLLILLNYARICRDLHSKEAYKEAIKMGQKAILLSQKMDSGKHRNLDAVVIISSALRKLIRLDTYGTMQAKENYNSLLKNTAPMCQDQTEQLPLHELCELFNALKTIADNGYFDAKSERIKWYYLNLTLNDDTQSMIHAENYPEKTKPGMGGIDDYFSQFEVRMDLRLKFLEGVVRLKEGKIEDAKKIFLELLNSPQYREMTKYIRPGTIGLKSRYLLARVYLSNGDYWKARKYLEEVHGTLQQLQNVDTDYRLVVDLAYCYIRYGDYERAFRLYMDNGLEKNRLYSELTESSVSSVTISKNQCGAGVQTQDESPDSFLLQLSPKRRISGLNNLIRCCLFSIRNPKDDLNQMTCKAFNYIKRHYPDWFKQYPQDKPFKLAYQLMKNLKEQIKNENFSPDQSDFDDKEKKQKIARNVIQYLNKKYSDIIDKDSETQLLFGYLKIISYDSQNAKLIDTYTDALNCFKKACHFNQGFISSNLENDSNKTLDKSRQRHSVEYLSAYLITVIRIYRLAKKEYNKEKVRDCEKELRRFLGGFPQKVKISMKAAVALAEWLLEYADNTENSENLFRSFCYVTIYEERGAMVFNQLKDNRDFRLLESRYRGEILALLLSMYKPIKALKEESAFNLDDLMRLNHSDDLDKPCLVHYTSMETLKVLLPKKIVKKPDKEKTEKAECEPRFRINNCGYMNDVFEGSVFLRCLKQVAMKAEDENNIQEPQTEEDSQNEKDLQTVNEYDKMFHKFFPYLEQTAMDRKPMASNVYIGSLSVKEDSFPIWDSYANKEKGCNICFGAHYFDINGAQYHPHQLREYMFSNHTDKSYPLYIVQYIKSKDDFQEHVNSYFNTSDYKITQNELEPIDIKQCGNREQHCGTEVIDYKDLCRFLHHIYLKWKYLDKRLDAIQNSQYIDTTVREKGTEQIAKRINLARQFAADRLNEIRFLFKDADYEFEAEVRIVHTEKADSSHSSIEYNKTVPSPYTNINRDLEGLTIRLGSKISDSDVDKIVTWLKQTGRVDTVMLSTRNRYILRTTQ